MDLSPLALSVVVPMYNEEAVLPLLVARLRPVLDGLDLAAGYEVVCVDDGSTDLTAAVLERLRREWPEVRVVRLRMNAGHQAALSAGLAAARGDRVVSIDADLQDPPEVIPEMLAVADEQDADVVYGVRNDRSTDTWFKRTTATAFYWVIGRLTQGSARSQSGDFRLMSRALVDAVNGLPEPGRVIRFAVPALGFPSAAVEYRRERRGAGKAKYGLFDMVHLSLDSITGVSTAPLRVATFVGFFGGMLAVVAGVTSVVAHLVDRTMPGWTSTVAIVSGFSALQLLSLGILGEYIGRTYQYLQNRPTYVVDRDSYLEGLEAEEAAPTAVAATKTDEPTGRSQRPRTFLSS
ncbi:glycosyltransferase family 2 protein [Nocardioides solisilvae]|uniref:glycosyltransferase family 2 protein n=1 Tax=Nocardioides solisilvae TaxID=1542435 RepID=UPI001EF69A79|nr:glycosyltransferase family 2 protein [Nocardioides solisilvae]